MVSLLFGKKMLLWLLRMWLVIVVVGSLATAFAERNAILTDFSVRDILSDKERLATINNVDYIPHAPGSSAEPITPVGDTSVAPVFPSRLRIPSLGMDLPVSNPQTRDIEALDEELKSAVVRYPDSATLGVTGGNVLLFGHSSRLPVVRNKFYKAFNGIETLKKGDIIEVVSGFDTYSYVVSRVYKASANDDRIALVVSGHRLTLLTCNSFGQKSDRWVVEAEYIGKNI